MRRGFAVVDGAVSEGRVVLDVHIPRLDELLVREPVLVILDGSKRPRPRVRGFASAIENRVGSWKGLGLGERDALGVELSQVAAADGV